MRRSRDLPRQRRLPEACRAALLHVLAFAGLWGSGPAPTRGDVLRYDSPTDWSQWSLPTGSLDVMPSGRLQPVALHKQSDAVRDAAAFGGGVWEVSSNQAGAGLAIDGDPATGWVPAGSDAEGDAFLEIDLGRAVSATEVTLTFDATAPPFELFNLLLSTGEPQVDIVGNPIGRQVIYRWSERVRGNRRHSVTFTLDPDAAPVRFVRVEPLLFDPAARLTEIGVRSLGDNAAIGLLDRGGNVDIVVGLGRNEFNMPLGNARTLFDGDLATEMRFGATPGRGTEDIDAHIVMDLGAAYWVDHVRIVGNALRSRRFNYKDYSLMTSDGSLAPDGTLIWERHFGGRGSDEDNRRGFVDHLFGLRPVRLVRVLWKFWDGACAVALAGGGQSATSSACTAGGNTEELQVFGEGFPGELTLRSPIIDLEERRNFGAVEWSGSAPAGTRIEVRTRSGDGVERQLIFRDRNGQEVTEQRWGKLIPSFRGPIDTVASVSADWSPWTPPYAGSGSPFASPAPRRYAQIEARLVTEDPDAAASLDWLQLTHTPPLALRTFGEVHPTLVGAGEARDFVYYVRTDSASAGFDGIVLESSARPQFSGAFVGGAPVEARVEETAAGFRATLPEGVEGGQLLELRFASAVYLHGTRFDAFLEDSRQPGDRQRVDAGDATALVAGDTDVVGLPVDGGLLAHVDFGTRVVTPNGDGNNDDLTVRVDVANVLLERPLKLRIYDLSGRLVAERGTDVLAGRREVTWTGEGGDGQPVPPGVYVVELLLEGDAGTQSERRTVAIVY